MNLLLKSYFATALLAFAAIAHAADQTTTIPANPDSTKPGIHLVLNAGITYGGDTIYTATYTNGNSYSVKGGALFQIGIGGLYQFEDYPVALMLSVNSHFDQVNATNGEVKFSRVPIEMLAYYTGKEKLRIGGGIRIVNSPEASASINGVSEKITFENTTGFVAEIGFQIAPHAWVNVRAVSEQYQGKERTFGGTTTSLAGTSAINGSHIGANFSFEF